MPTCTIDGKKIEFKPGENLVDIAKRGGIEIPVFCYHPGLSVVAQCRMCAVEVQGMGKLQTACSTPATDGMVVNTQSEKSKKNRASVMEFLLINHPLDCPVCDKSGECDLQDGSFNHGSPYMRYTEERRTYLDLDMGPVIKKNMNRCIHCTRCIRFGAEVAGIREMVALERGNRTEITTLDGKPLETDYAGNYSDICPTGSLTLKDFRFHKRAWMLKKTASVCEGCSRGCNMEIQQDNNIVFRCIPKENLEVNRYWMCDEGRFNYHYLRDPNRIIEPMAQTGGTLSESNWDNALAFTRDQLKGKRVTILIGSDHTQEEAQLIQKFSADHFSSGKAGVFHFGTPGVVSSKDDASADELLKRKSKTSNLHGMEKLGIPGFEKLPADTEAVLVFRAGRAVLPELRGVEKFGVGVFFKGEVAQFKSILPGAAFAEKDGTIVNFQGKEQKLKRSVLPRGSSKLLGETLMLWMNSKAKTGAA